MRSAALTLLLFFAAPSAARAAPVCVLFEVKSAGEAKLIVFFTRFPTEDKSGGKYKQCRVVKKSEKSAETFFITSFRKEANLIVHHSNWPD